VFLSDFSLSESRRLVHARMTRPQRKNCMCVWFSVSGIRVRWLDGSVVWSNGPIYAKRGKPLSGVFERFIVQGSSRLTYRVCVVPRITIRITTTLLACFVRVCPAAPRARKSKWLDGLWKTGQAKRDRLSSNEWTVTITIYGRDINEYQHHPASTIIIHAASPSPC